MLTADTFGTSKHELDDSCCNMVVLQTNMHDTEKGEYLGRLGGENVAAIGNGQNDTYMLYQAGLSIMVVQQEGAFARLINVSDIMCCSIIDALNLLLNPARIIATLRK